MKRFGIAAAATLLLVALLAAGASRLRPEDRAWSSQPIEVDGRLRFREHLSLTPAPVYNPEEQAAQAEQIDEIRFLLPHKLAEIFEILRFEARVGVGAKAPDFELRTIDGDSLRLSALEGRVAVFMFAAMTCPPARMQVPRFEALRAKYAAQDVAFFLVYSRERHPGESGFPDLAYARDDGQKQELAQMLGELTNLPIAVDGIDEHVLGLYGEVPNSAYVVDREGTIVFRSTWADSAKVERVLDTLLAHEKGYPFTRTRS